MLNFRHFEDTDTEHLLRLWKEETDWGELDESQWHDLLVDTPQGKSDVVVAVDHDGRVIGQLMVMPSRAIVEGREIRVGRIMAPIIHRSLRMPRIRSTDHPIFGLFKMLMDPLIIGKYDMYYAFPESSWLPFVRWLPSAGIPAFSVAAFPCVDVSLEHEPVCSKMGGGLLTVQPSTTIDEQYDELWSAAQSSFGFDCVMTRSQQRLRFNSQRFLTIEVRRTGQTKVLEGYLSIKKSDSLLVDIMVRHPDKMEEVLGTTLKWLSDQRKRSPEGTISHLNAMVTPALSNVVHNLGFKPKAYKFAFICKSLTLDIPDDTISPDRWFLMPGD